MSADMAAAQARLLALRAEAEAQKAAAGLALSDAERDALHVATFERPRRDPLEGARAVAIARTVKPAAPEPEPIDFARLQALLKPPPEPAPEPAQIAPTTAATAATVKHYATLGIAFLRQNLASEGRAWLLFRERDRAGRGWLTLDDARAVAEQCAMTWRRMRQILTAGAGRLWDRDGDRVYYYSPARASLALDAGRLRGQPVLLPVDQLRGGVRKIRALFFASYHAGRPESRQNNPISRAALRSLTGVPESTQRVYTAVARIRRRANFALGERTAPANVERTAWEHGRAAFTFTDHIGKYGHENGRYSAWQLPNSYDAPLTTARRGRQQKINERIALVANGRPGNGSDVDRLYYENGKAAVKAASRRRGPREIYFALAAADLRPAHFWTVVQGAHCV